MQIKVKFEYYMISIFACEMLMAVFILNSKWDVDIAAGITPQSQTSWILRKNQQDHDWTYDQRAKSNLE